MDETKPSRAKNARAKPKKWWRRRWVKIVASIIVVCVAGLAIAGEYVLHHAAPILRRRVVETLEQHFKAPVELDRLDISLVRGIEVRGEGLRIGQAAPQGQAGTGTGSAPLVAVDRFLFRTTFHGLLERPTHVAEVDVEGMRIDVPPGGIHTLQEENKAKTKSSVVVNVIRATNVTLTIETTKPGKDPRVFDIQRVVLKNVGPSRPLAYDAELINPVPRGEIHAVGDFGPWASGEPRQTPVDGDYSFEHADLGTIKGIGGTLSSTGHFAGVLDHITIDGTTDVPNFSLDVGDHAAPLHTVFHAYVDGTNGDVVLDPVQARLLHSDFTCRGTVIDIHGEGHDIALDVEMTHARIEDMLELAVKTNPPLMSGALAMRARLHLPPGDVRVMQKLGLAGDFSVADVRFSNPKWQDKVDDLSLRAQGKPEEAEQAGKDRVDEVQSEMKAQFALGKGLITVSGLDYTIPGAQVTLNGVYSTDGSVFEFKGHVKTKAMASQMMTGWKSILLTPLDPFLKKNGAGLELPISISGTQGDVHFGLVMHGSNETAQQIKVGVKAKAAAKTAQKDGKK